MSLQKGFQLYDITFESNVLAVIEEPAWRERIRGLEEKGVVIEAYTTADRSSVFLRVYHPERCLDSDELRFLDTFYYANKGGWCGLGFLGEVSPIKEDCVKLYSTQQLPATAEQKVGEVRSESEIDIILKAMDINTAAEALGTSERINSSQIAHRIEESRRIWKLRESSRYRILGVDTWDWDDRVVGDFDSADEALVHAYWEAYLERQYHHLIGTMQIGDDTSILRKFHHIEEGEDGVRFGYPKPSPRFVRNIKRNARRIKQTKHATSEMLYIYDPEGNLIDKVRV